MSNCRRRSSSPAPGQRKIPEPAPKRAVVSPAKSDVGLDPDLTIEWLPALRGFAGSLTRNATDAEDLVQETLLKAVRYQDKFRSGTNLKAWLFVIMRNSFYNQIAKRRREVTGPEGCVSEHVSSPATQEWSLRGKEVMRAVRDLPPHYRRLFVLVVMLGETYETSAELCGIRVGTVKSRVNRSRRLVIASLGDDGP
ncbi:sigma-70 family RNA polymerase sigma factor [Maritimibacter sp. DP1N21-5]|nr:sigma-70 family RNA polymerase sigma factor [Maritimibacter sp. DP1N21-5]